jgi:flavodoxin
MKVLVVYDSVYGNTQKIAEAIGSAAGSAAEVVRASQVDPERLAAVDLLVVGAPTQGGRPTKPVQDLIAGLPEAAVKGKKFASFDTRYSGRFVKVFGFAADRIAEVLSTKGGQIVSTPQAFFVSGKKGPLKEGELERAANWAKDLVR